MDRLHMKCFVASAGIHLLLAGIFLFGSAFRSRTSGGGGMGTEMPLIQLVEPPKETETVAFPPSETRVPAAPGAAAQAVVAKESKQAEPAPVRARQSSTEQSNRKSQPANSSNASTERARQLSKAIEDVARKLPTNKALELGSPSGSSNQNDQYARLVRFFYTQSWQPSDDGVENPNASAKVSVSIESDGRVSTSRITEPSGDARLDASVQRALARVQFIEPFEQGANETERTYTLNFSLRLVTE